MPKPARRNVAGAGSLAALLTLAVLTGCASQKPPDADRSVAAPPGSGDRPKANPDGYSVDPGAKKGDPFGYDGRKWRRGLGG